MLQTVVSCSFSTVQICTPTEQDSVHLRLLVQKSLIRGEKSMNASRAQPSLQFELAYEVIAVLFYHLLRACVFITEGTFCSSHACIAR